MTSRGTRFFVSLALAILWFAVPAGAVTPPLTVPPDTAAPTLSKAMLDTHRLRALRRGAVEVDQAWRRAHPRAHLRFELSEPATLNLQMMSLGVKPGATAVASALLEPVAELTRSGQAGPNSITFSGRFAGVKLLPGSYRGVLVAVDAAGNRSLERRVAFRVVAHGGVEPPRLLH